MALNLEPETRVPGDPGGGGAKAGKAEPPPTVEEVAALFPQLEVLEFLGRGGMGCVYRARQRALNRLVALKILARGREADPAFAERFTREAQALARLHHPGIVTVYDFGQANGHYYLLMEYVDGVSLRQLLADGRMGPESALAVVPKICEALQFAHQQGVVHRDIKPENILLDKAGQVKIADFGIAKIVGEDKGQPGLTGAKDVVGTPHYMAPEQVEHPQRVDHRADIFSLGVVFYEMLTGELPLGKFAPPSERMHGVRIDVRLDEIVLHTLEKEPERRYQQAREVKTDVETLVLSSGEAKPGRVPAQDAPRETSGALARAVVVSRWTARIFSVLLLLFFGFFILAEGLPPIGSQPGGVQLGFLALGLMFAGFIVGWRSEGWGALLIAAGWALREMAEGRFRLNLFQTPVPVAMLFAFCWWATRGRQTAKLAVASGAVALALFLGWLFLPSSVFVRGVVKDAATGEGIPGAELRLGTDAGNPKARSLAEGRFSMYIGWYSEGTPVIVSAPGYDTLRAGLDARPLGSRRIARDFTLEPARPAEPAAAYDFRADTPPVVIQTVPESGTEDVDPGLTLIKATFSKPMVQDSWSWCYWTKEVFPEAAGEPAFLGDGRTCVLPVRLQPGRVYAIWLNTENDNNFKDLDGHPAVPYLLIFETRK